MYLELCEEAIGMEYIIATDKPNYQIEMEEELCPNEKQNPYNIFKEYYSRAEVPPLIYTIDKFERWLEQTGLKETYLKYWKAS
jgi:hypothetical protein